MNRTAPHRSTLVPFVCLHGTQEMSTQAGVGSVCFRHLFVSLAVLMGCAVCTAAVTLAATFCTWHTLTGIGPNNPLSEAVESMRRPQNHFQGQDLLMVMAFDGLNTVIVLARVIRFGTHLLAVETLHWLTKVTDGEDATRDSGLVRVLRPLLIKLSLYLTGRYPSDGDMGRVRAVALDSVDREAYQQISDDAVLVSLCKACYLWGRKGLRLSLADAVLFGVIYNYLTRFQLERDHWQQESLMDKGLNVFFLDATFVCLFD